MARQVGKFVTALCCAMVMFSGLHSAEGLSLAEQDALLKKHNSLRAGVPVPKLKWDANAASAAQQWADGCVWSHTSNSFGQNLYQTMSTASFAVQPSHLAGGVQAWYDEVQWYSYGNNKCNAPPGYSCGHYTQVVWRKTTRVGCGYARCENSASMNPLKKWKTLIYLVCFYSPPGNYIGQSPYLRAYVDDSSQVTNVEVDSKIYVEDSSPVTDVEVDSKIFETDAEDSSQFTNDEQVGRTDAETFSVITSDELDSRAAPINMCDGNEFVALHNRFRQSVKPGLKIMSWNTTLADLAQSWTNVCLFKHNYTRKYTQNLFGHPGKYAPPKDVVGLWGSEQKNYNLTTMSCQPGKVCGHFTQLVWHNSTQLGCGCTYCPNNKGIRYIVACNYSPPGNVGHQKPFHN